MFTCLECQISYSGAGPRCEQCAKIVSAQADDAASGFNQAPGKYEEMARLYGKSWCEALASAAGFTEIAKQLTSVYLWPPKLLNYDELPAGIEISVRTPVEADANFVSNNTIEPSRVDDPSFHSMLANYEKLFTCAHADLSPLHEIEPHHMPPLDERVLRPDPSVPSGMSIKIDGNPVDAAEYLWPPKPVNDQEWLPHYLQETSIASASEQKLPEAKPIVTTFLGWDMAQWAAATTWWSMKRSHGSISDYKIGSLETAVYVQREYRAAHLSMQPYSIDERSLMLDFPELHEKTLNTRTEWASVTKDPKRDGPWTAEKLQQACGDLRREPAPISPFVHGTWEVELEPVPDKVAVDTSMQWNLK